MKNLKSLVLVLLMGLLTFTSCENEEAILDDQVQDVTVESESITAALNAMTTNFDDSGNVDPVNNPAGNIIFDFCFDFVYPITLSYNTGATVSVNDLDGLINVIINSTDQLFINGIAFPFDVETYDEATDSIVIQTINNEAEFADLLTNCDFDGIDDCNCTDEYDPVCVEIIDPNGTIFFITYPNECYAQCDGFDDDDYEDDCDDDDYYDDDFLCFDFIYPLDIILDDGTVVTITDDDDFENTMYNNYFFNFVYPISVELDDDDDDDSDDDTIVVINNEQEFQDLLDDCFGFPGGGGGCDQCENDPIDPVCVEFIDPSGNVIIVTYPNLCFAQCFGYTTADVVDCNNNNPTDCTEQDVLDALIDCDTWSADVNGTTFHYEFDINTGLVDVIDDQDNVVTSGNFEIIEEATTGNVFILIVTSSQNFSDVWYFFDCNSPDDFQVVSSSSIINNVEPDCD